QVVWIDVFKPDKDATHAGSRRFFNKVWNLVAKRVDLDRKTKFVEFGCFQIDQAIKQNFPVTVAREIIIRDEETLNALGMVLAHNFFEVIRRAKPALAPLHVDDRAE